MRCRSAGPTADSWTIDDRHVYQDDAVSGADVRKLVNRQQLLETIRRGGAPFQVLIMRDTSRFSRRDGDEAFGELKAIAQAGIAIWFYQDALQFAFGTLSDNVVGFVRAEVAAEFRRLVSKWTKEAMVRKAAAGHATGGAVFGYDLLDVMKDGRRVPRPPDQRSRHPEASHVERTINEAEAAIVRRVFQLSAEGYGVKAIAWRLNDEGVPSPRAQRGRSQTWAPSSVREVLYRDLYRGVVVYNKTRKRDASGKVNQAPRPAAEWITTPAPHLAIVTADAWQTAHVRLSAARAIYLKGRNTNRSGGRRSAHRRSTSSRTWRSAAAVVARFTFALGVTAGGAATCTPAADTISAGTASAPTRPTSR